MPGPIFAPILFGLASALCWGAGDFSGGLATRRVSVYGVTLLSQGIGVLLLLGLALVFLEPLPAPANLLWAGLGGASGALGLIALYRSLASGRMGVAAPLSAVVTAIVPVLYSYFLNGRPALTQQIGFALALFAIGLIARPGNAALHLRELGLPLLAGVGFGMFFILIHRASETAILWPLVAARAASALLLLLLTLGLQPKWSLERGSLSLILLAGVLDIGGNAFFVLAGRTGRLDIAAVIGSLYPGMTVWLAWLILKERITRLQTVGILLAFAAIVMIAA